MKHRSTVIGCGLVGVSVLVACSNDGLSAPTGGGGNAGSSNAGSAGTAGSDGMAGSAGMGGTMMSSGGAGGTATAGAGGTATAGSGGMGGTAPDVELTPPDCSGCIELRVPVTGSTQTAYFNLQLSGARDFSAGRITYRMQALTFDQNFVAEPFINQSDFAALEFGPPLVLSEDVSGNEEPTALGGSDAGVVDAGGLAGEADASAPAEDGFFNFVFDVEAFPANSIDKADIVLFGLRVGTTSSYAGGAATVRVVLDSVRFTGVSGVPDLEFTASNQNFILNTFVDRTPGSEVIHYP